LPETAVRVSSGELIRKFSQFCDVALREPIIVTKNGRDRLVLISVDEYNHLSDVIVKQERTTEIAKEKSQKSGRRTARK
jgi:prevent-host-death family protein